MIGYLEKSRIINEITIPEIKSSVAQLFAGLKPNGDNTGHRLTLLALLSFYRKNLNNNMSIETDQNRLKARLIESGVLYFGPLFDPATAVSRAKRLQLLAEQGFAVDHLAFLNGTQVELFYTYLKETGLVSTR